MDVDVTESALTENGLRWRRSVNEPAAIAAVAAFLEAMGLDEGPHTADTPARVYRAWLRRTEGYGLDPYAALSVRFPVEGDAGLVVVSGVRFASTCAHHLLPIEGIATIAYRPYAESGEVVGLSKLVRLLRVFSARLQVQERLGRQVVDTLVDALAAQGAAVVLTARHGCMTVRGIDEPDSLTTTLSLGGAWTPGDDDVRHVVSQHERHAVR